VAVHQLAQRAAGQLIGGATEPLLEGAVAEAQVFALVDIGDQAGGVVEKVLQIAFAAAHERGLLALLLVARDGALDGLGQQVGVELHLGEVVGRPVLQGLHHQGLAAGAGHHDHRAQIGVGRAQAAQQGRAGRVAQLVVHHDAVEGLAVQQRHGLFTGGGFGGRDGQAGAAQETDDAFTVDVVIVDDEQLEEGGRAVHVGKGLRDHQGSLTATR
jgi:hypothetical protein